MSMKSFGSRSNLAASGKSSPLLMERKRDNAAIVESVDSFCKENEQSMSEYHLVTYNIVVEWGHPAEKILEYAENHGYVMIIMWRRPFRTWYRIGNSTSVEVAQRSIIPVMIVQVPSS